MMTWNDFVLTSLGVWVGQRERSSSKKVVLDAALAAAAGFKTPAGPALLAMSTTNQLLVCPLIMDQLLACMLPLAQLLMCLVFMDLLS